MMMDSRRRPGRRPHDSYRPGRDVRRNAEVTDWLPSPERLPGQACPICAQFSAPIEELIVHIIVFHKYEDVVLRTALDEFPARDNEFICGTCRGRLPDANSFYRHFFNHHRPKLIDILQSAARQVRGKARPHDLQPLLSRFPPAPSTPDDSDPVDAEEDESYVQFIAGSIQSDGIVPRDRVDSPDLAPIRAAQVEARQAAPVAAAIDKQFWADLDRLDACMRATGKVDMADGEFKCKICRKKYNSAVRLLEHCWELHRNLLLD
jgi:hypothetical protein